MKKALFLMFASLPSFSWTANIPTELPISSKTCIIGGGIIGALESYFAFQEAQKNGKKICINVYEKSESFNSTSGKSSTNTAYNIGPSLTIDEILSVVPRGTQLIEKLALLFSQPGGIRVDDVPGVNDSEAAINFKRAVTIYGSDPNHDDRTLTLLTLGRKSMELWQQIYDEGDSEIKEILEAANFHPCREPRKSTKRALHDGYRIDLIYGIPNVETRALSMKADYEKLGYKNCKILTPSEVIKLDPYLTDFCHNHSNVGSNKKRVWNNDCVALWRPGGCIETRTLLPKLYAYLKKNMGQYVDTDKQVKDCFQIEFDKEVTGIEFAPHSQELKIIGLKFSNGKQQIEKQTDYDCKYIFCTGEGIGTLHRLGFQEPAYASFAGPSLLLTIPLTKEQINQFNDFSHCMEVHNEGIVLAWQARFRENMIFISVSGTKAFYGDKQPNKDEAFAKNRNLVQLNMINDVLPQFVSIACKANTNRKTLSYEDLMTLEEKGIAKRWVGRRAVAYDGFPTIGSLYCNNQKVSNARCTTHLGSGGVSFGPGAVYVSRCSELNSNDPLIEKILIYSDSRRTAE